MKKFIKSSLITFTLITAVIMNGCDAFENFLFDLPISFEIESVNNNPTGSKTFCLTDDETYLDYADKINSITFVDAYIVTREVNPDDMTGPITFELRDGNDNPIIQPYSDNITPADYYSPNAYHLTLDQSQIDDINASLANGNRCFKAVYSVSATSGDIKVKVDLLFNIDAQL